MRRGAADSAVAYLRRALEEPPPPDRRTGILLALGAAEALTSGPAAAEHLRAALDALVDPVDAGTGRRRPRPRADLHRQAGGGGRADAPSRGRAAAGPRRAARPARGARADHAATSATCGRSCSTASRATATRSRRRRRCSRSPRTTGATAAARPSDCCRLALAALERGDLIERENGTFSISALCVLGLADREEAVALWDASLEAAHRNGSLFSSPPCTSSTA